MKEKTYKHTLYGLIDPRDGKICYIGVTSNDPRKRLSQHNNAINDTPISKLSQHLKKNRLGKLTMVTLKEFDTKEECYQAEIDTIKMTTSSGKALKNVATGGQVTILPKESYLKGVETRRSNGVYDYSVVGGFQSSRATLNEGQFNKIVGMILAGYSNEEISIECTVGTSLVKSIRSGQNWYKSLPEGFPIGIPSIPLYGACNSSRLKLCIVHMIVLGNSLDEVSDSFPVSKSDLQRIASKTLWKKVWKVYEKLAPEVRNNLCKSIEFRENLTADSEDNPERSLCKKGTCND